MLVSIAELKTFMDISLTNRQTDAAEMILEGLQSELEAYLGRPIEISQYEEDHIIPTYVQSIPESNHIYDRSLDTSNDPVYYIDVPVTVSVKNSPIVSVNSVTLRTNSGTTRTLSEAIRRDAIVTDVTIGVGGTVTYECENDFAVGQFVDVKNVVPDTMNVSRKQIVAADDDSFTIKDDEISGTYVSGGDATANGSDYRIFPYGIELYSVTAGDRITIDYHAGLDGTQTKIFRLMILRAATREMQNMHDDTVGVKDLNTRGVAVMETGFLEKELLAVKAFKRRRIA